MTKPKAKTKNGVSARVQQTIPGTERTDQIEAIDEAIADFLQERRTIAKLNKAVKELKAAVIQSMRDHKLKVYLYEDAGVKQLFTVPTKTELKQERVKEPRKARAKAKRGATASEVTAPEVS